MQVFRPDPPGDEVVLRPEAPRGRRSLPGLCAEVSDNGYSTAFWSVSDTLERFEE